jgi:hypothetical protein
VTACIKRNMQGLEAIGQLLAGWLPARRTTQDPPAQI